MQIYRIAGLCVGMDTFGRTLRQSAPYLTHGAEADFVIPAEEPPVPLSSEADDAEYMRTCSLFYVKLLDYSGFMLHSSCVVLDGRAYLFSAPCGTGKSTHTQLWLKTFGDRAYILNDDKPALRLIDGKWFVYGTPWSGKTDQNVNACVPLGGIAVLERAEENSAETLSGIDAVFALADQTLRPMSPRRFQTLANLMDKIISDGYLCKVRVNMEQDAAAFTHDFFVKNIRRV